MAVDRWYYVFKNDSANEAAAWKELWTAGTMDVPSGSLLYQGNFVFPEGSRPVSVWIIPAPSGQAPDVDGRLPNGIDRSGPLQAGESPFETGASVIDSALPILGGTIPSVCP